MRLAPVQRLKQLEPAAQALAKQVPLWTPEFVFEQIGKGNVQPYEIHDDIGRVGFALLKVERFGTGKVLDIWGLWAEPNAPRGWIPKFFELCREHAKKIGCAFVAAASPRKGWGRYVAREGEVTGTVYRLRGA